MSELREVSIPVDERLVEAMAREKGNRVERGENVVIRGYATHKLIPDLVVRFRDWYCDLGVVEKKFVFDEDRNIKDSPIRQFLHQYTERYIKSRIPAARLVENNERQMVFVVGG